MITQTDIKTLEKIFTTKKEFYRGIEELLEFLADFRSEFEDFRTEMRSFRSEVNDILNNHERSIDKLEDKVFN